MEFELLTNEYARRRAEEQALRFNTSGMSHPSKRAWTADDFLPDELKRRQKRMMSAAEMLGQCMKDAGQINALKGRI